MPRLGRVAEAKPGQGGGTAGPATSCSVPALTTRTALPAASDRLLGPCFKTGRGCPCLAKPLLTPLHHCAPTGVPRPPGHKAQGARAEATEVRTEGSSVTSPHAPFAVTRRIPRSAGVSPPATIELDQENSIFWCLRVHTTRWSWGRSLARLLNNTWAIHQRAGAVLSEGEQQRQTPSSQDRVPAIEETLGGCSQGDACFCCVLWGGHPPSVRAFMRKGLCAGGGGEGSSASHKF